MTPRKQNRQTSKATKKKYKQLQKFNRAMTKMKKKKKKKFYFIFFYLSLPYFS